MKLNFLRLLNEFPREQDGAGGGGGGQPPAPGGGGAPGDGGGAPAPGAPSDQNGGTPPGDNGAPPPSIYRPEGLADHFVGKTDPETIDNLKKALDGYRARDASNQVPADIAEYAKFTGDIPEVIKPHLDSLAADPLFERASKVALEHGISSAAYQTMVTELFAGAAEAGLLEPPVDFAAEKTALVPDNARHLPEAEQTAAREARMNQNFAFVDSLTSAGLSKDAAEHAKAMLGDTAAGHQFMETVQKLISGTGRGPSLNQPGDRGTDPKADLARRAALPENIVGHIKFDPKSHAQLQEDYKKVHGN